MFRVSLDVFNGPLDLLLFLIRKHELDIFDIPITKILEQYMEFLNVLKEINIDSIGEFLVLASTLLEIKSYQTLPSEEEVEEELEDPRKDLVVQLLAYKKFCKNAGFLEERGRIWQRRYPRLANDIVPRSRNYAEEPIQEVELWDLVSAFGRILRERSPSMKHVIVKDDIPVSVHMQRIHNRLKRERKIDFTSLFRQGDPKSTLVGIFLAVLELVRHEFAYVEQEVLFGEIRIEYRESSRPLDFASLDQDHQIHFEQAG
ncbi:MAG: segregation/condensation protein A [Thermoguttaceae bacterium]|nr:segregation/condensation protein A [Thermoguttaceae bacterium]